MYPPDVLKAIYAEHRHRVPLMVETLLHLDVPTEDARLLGRMPWELPANRIAVERERLGLSPVHPFIYFKPSPPPAWLTPAMIVQIFQLALDGPGNPLPGVTEDDQPTGRTLVLPA